MEQKPNITFLSGADTEAIGKILSEKENDAAVKDKMYRILYEASCADDIDIDTDLIDECIKTIDLIEDDENHLSKEKIEAMRRSIDQRYKDWQNVRRKKQFRKRFAQIAACLLLAFFMSSAAAGAFGFNLIQTMVQWGKDTFHLSAQKQSNERRGNNNAVRTTYSDLDKVFEDITSKPLLPEWLPDDFAFKFAEKFSRLDSTNILIYYENSEDKEIIFDFSIYDDSRKVPVDADYEKDDNLVEVYEENDMKRYILKNLEQFQAVWSDSNIVYSISGNISADEIKKIIHSMYGG